LKTFLLFILDKVIDLQQAMLPEPFNLSTELSSTSDEIEPLPHNLHLSSCSKRHFSDKSVANQTEQIQCLSSSKNFLDNQESDAHGRKNVHRDRSLTIIVIIIISIIIFIMLQMLLY